MELTHQFTVPASLDVAWAAFNDLERIAPCFPGASLTSFDGESFEGICKVKLGPISLQYSGSGRFVERDETSHRAVIEAKGRDKRGNGTAAANVTATLAAAGDDSTDVHVVSELNITGRPAQFGRGVMQDVSDKLLGEFASCLESKLASSGESAPDDAAPQAEETPPTTEAGAVVDAPVATETVDATESAVPTDGSAAPGPSAASEATATKTTATEPAAMAPAATAPAATAPAATAPAATEHSPAAELDLGATVLPVLLKRYGPRILVVLLVLVILRRLLSRR